MHSRDREDGQPQPARFELAAKEPLVEAQVVPDQHAAGEQTRRVRGDDIEGRGGDDVTVADPVEGAS